MILLEFIFKRPFKTESRHRFLMFLENMGCAHHDIQKSIFPVGNNILKVKKQTLEQGLKYFQN